MPNVIRNDSTGAVPQGARQKPDEQPETDHRQQRPRKGRQVLLQPIEKRNYRFFQNHACLVSVR